MIVAVCLLAVGWWAKTPVLPGPGSAATAFGELTGMVAGVLICAQILLVARVPWFERAVGLDRLVAWHRTLGASVLLLTLTHVVFIVVGGMSRDGVSLLREVWSTTLPQPDVLTAALGTGLLVVVGVSSARAARVKLSYEAWYWLHTSTYVAVFLTFGHQINAGAHFVGSPMARVAWTLLYLATASAVVVWRVVLPLAAVLRHDVRVERIVQETPSVVSVWLSGRHLDDLDVRPGQFFLFRFLTRGHLGTAHPYSVSHVPDDGRLRITVGALGDHSAQMAGLRPGTRALLEGPFGHFTPDRSPHGKVLLIAGGAGIGPITALAHQMSAEGRDVVLLHRSPSAHELPLREELMALRGVRFIPLLGHRAQLGYDPLSAVQVGGLVPDAAQRDAFICGSPGMTEAAVSTLRELGLASHQIHHEELSLS